MWVFDGEQWIQEGVGSGDAVEQREEMRREEFQPELQIIPVPVRREEVPPFPMTIP